MTTEAPEDMSKYRLPSAVKPLVYELFLYPNLQTGRFDGMVKVFLEILSDTDSVVLHSHLLTIIDVSMDSGSLNYALDAKHQLLTITKGDGSNFQAGHETIDIEFSGDMRNKLVGLYTSNYTTSTGRSRPMAASTFQPTYARQAFPCFDEPNMKAKFRVFIAKLRSNTNYKAVSNRPIYSTDNFDETLEMVTFKETVCMSTHLVCVTVSDFLQSFALFDNNGTLGELVVYASPSNMTKTPYAEQVGERAVSYYVKYFGIGCPLPTLKLLATPDFVCFATAHWGVVTFKEAALLFSDTIHSALDKQRVATAVAHAIAHHWFGILVTMNWWSDLWLSEGFASYIQYKGVMAAEPSWDMKDQFLTAELHPVLSWDAMLCSHPIVQTVLTPAQIAEMFDPISYNKGASILRMLESIMGEEDFRNSVINYLNKYAYSNAVTANFFTEIQQIVGDTLEVAEIMDTFTKQMGYPLLTVTVEGDNYTLTQARFLIDPSAQHESSDSIFRYKWTVPVTYVTDLGKSRDIHVFKHDADSITIQKPPGATWIKFNYDQMGYYRVTYPESEWNTLIGNYQSLSTADRTHVLEELFSLAEAGHVAYSLPLDLATKLGDEMDYTPWAVASTQLQAILRYLNASSSLQQPAFKLYVSRVVTPAYNNLIWNEPDEDKHMRRLARIEVLNLACAVEHTECLAEAERQFYSWIDLQTTLSQDLRSLVYKYGMKNADEETWMKLFDIYQREDDALEKLKLINGLANVQNETLLRHLIDLCRHESIVRSHDYFCVMQFISENPMGTPLVWDWVREHWNDLVRRFTLNNRYLGCLIPAITKSFATQKRLAEMQAFFARHPDAGAGTANRAKALETVHNNIRWLANYKAVVEDWVSGTDASS